MKPKRHIWEEDSTHRAVAGKEYDEVWDYAEQLEARKDDLLDKLVAGEELYISRGVEITKLRAKNDALKKRLALYESMKTTEADDEVLRQDEQERLEAAFDALLTKDE